MFYAGEAEFLHQKKLTHQSVLMSKLTNQMIKRQKYVESENNKALAEENQMLNDGMMSLQATAKQK